MAMIMGKEKGPGPDIVSAAIMQEYVVYGLRLFTYAVVLVGTV